MSDRVYVVACRPFAEKIVDDQIHLVLEDAIDACDKLSLYPGENLYKVYEGVLQLNKNPIHHGRKARDDKQSGEAKDGEGNP